jgi:hypothetical protein
LHAVPDALTLATPYGDYSRFLVEEFKIALVYADFRQKDKMALQPEFLLLIRHY